MSLLLVDEGFMLQDKRPPTEGSFSAGKKYNCTVDPKRFMYELLLIIGMGKTGEDEKEIIYPQNILRNAAIKMCPSEWILTLDVDMIPQPSLHQRLERYLTDEETYCSKCAFVIPTYEVQLPSDNTPMVKRLPNTKEDLLHLIKNETARPFHIAILKENQKASKLTEWEKLPALPSNDIQVAYSINYTFLYEPVYVARRGFPLYDEQFIGFGRTRNTQAYEMFLSGYKFILLDNAFLTHWGFQLSQGRPRWRRNQSMRNYGLSMNWLLQMTIKYDSDPLNLIETTIENQDKRRFRVKANQPPGSNTRKYYCHHSFPYLYNYLA